MSYVIDKVKQIKPSGIRRFFEMAKEVENTISLSVGEPDFPTPDHIKIKGIEAIKQDLTFYTPNAGLKQLRNEISLFVKRRYNLDYAWNETLVTIGGSEAIDIAFRGILQEGDEVILTDPGYVSYQPNASLTGAKVVYYILEEQDDFKIKKEKLEKLITPKTKCLVLNYPNNPTGATMDKDDLIAISEVCIKHDIFVISDEVYCELTYNKKHFSIGEIENMKQRCLIINAFSKSYSMTGWRIGYILGSLEIINELFKIHQYSVISASTISQYAGIEALKNGDVDIEYMNKEYIKRRDYAYKRLKDMGLSCYFPTGAFYIFINIKKYHQTSEEFALNLLYKAKVVVVPGSAFGQHGEGFLRLSYASKIETLKEGFDRIESYLKTL